MATLEQLQRAYEIARRDGDTEDIQVLEAALRQASGAQRSEGTSSEDIRRRYLESLKGTSDFRYSRPGFLENIGAGFGAGAVGTGELAALGAATLLEEEDELAALKKIQDFASGVRPEGGDPDSITYKLASGLGSIAGFATPALLAAAAPISAPVAGGLALTGAAGLGVAATAGEASERARAAGIPEAQRNVAIGRIAPFGVVEAIPLGRIFSRIPRLGKLFSDGDEEFTKLVEYLRSSAKTGAFEGAQEAAMGIAQNLNERGYNVERELIDAGVLEEGAVGAGAGAILQGVVDAFTKGRSRRAPVIEEPPATEEEIVEEQQLLGLPAPARPDELVQVRMPDGSVQEVPAQIVEEARRKEREAREAAVQQEQQKRQEVIQEEERRGSARVPTELLDERLTADMSPEERARVRAQDEQIDAFTVERQAEQAKVDRKERQDRRAARRLGLRGDRIEDQPVLPGFEQDTEVQREMFGTRRVAGKDVPTIKRQKVTPESERLMPKPAPAPEQQDMGFEQQQEQQALIGPKGGIPRRRKEPFKKPEDTPKAQEPAPSPDILTDARLNDLGIAPKSPARKALVGKDINQPAIQQRLQNFVESPRLGSQQARANVARLLEGVSERQGDLFTPTTQRRRPAPETGVRDARATESQQVSSGVSVPTVVPDVGTERAVPPAQSDTAVAVAPEGTGVADTGRGVGEPVRGAVAEQPALSELDQQLIDAIQNKEKPLSDEDFSTLRGRLAMNMYGDVDQRVTDAFIAESERRRQPEKTKTTKGTKPGEKTTAPKQVTQKDKKAKAPAEQKKKVKAKSAPKKEAPKRAKLGDDPEVRARLESLKKDLKDESTFKRYASPNTNTIPDDADPTTDKDNKIVANKLKVGTKNNLEDKAIEAYLGRRERVIDGLDAAIYDLVVKTETDRVQEGRSEADKKFFAGTRGVERTVEKETDLEMFDPEGRSLGFKKEKKVYPAPAELVVKWAEKNLSKSTQLWMKKRRGQLEMQDIRLTAKRAGEDVVVKQREADEAKKLASTQRARAKAELETYAQDDPFMTPAERRRAKRLMAAIDEFNEDMPYELRTRDVVLGIEIHPAAVAALKDGDIAGALRIVAASPDKDVARFARAFAENIGDTKVELFSSTAKDSLAGSFDPKTNTIRLNTANGIRQHTLLHEVGHALTSATLAKPSHPLTKQLNTLYNDVKDLLGTAYGTKNLDEFVAEAQSNRLFRAELASINPNGSNINALQRFLNSVGNFLRRLVGRDAKSIDSAMTKVDALINEIIAPAPEFRDANILAMESTHDGVQDQMRVIGRIQKTVGKPLTKEGREEFGQSFKDYVDLAGDNYGWIPLKFLDMSAFVDASKAINAKLGAVSQKALVTMEKMRGATAERNNATRDAIKPIERWFDNATPEQTKLINDIIYSREYGATIFQVDPTLTRAEAEKKYKGKPDKDANDLWAIWQENQKQWQKLDPEGRKVYKDMQAFYRKQFSELKEVIFSRIETMADGDTETIAKLKTEFEKKLFDKKGMDVYFPLIREGRYKIGFRYKPGKTPKGQDNFVFEMHQNRSDWLAHLREIESNPDMELVRSSDNESFVNYATEAPSTSFVNQTLKMMEAKKVDNEVQEAFLRMVVTTLPESSLARSLQSRKNTAGHESDALYAIKTKGFDLGNQIEKLKFSGNMQNILSDLDKVSRSEEKNFAPEKKYMLDNMVNDLKARMKFAVSGAEYKKAEGIARLANQLAFVGTIGFNTASAIVQTAQIPMVVMPMMMAKYGVRPTLQAMYRAMRIVTSARNHRPETMDFSKLSGKYFVEKGTDLADKFSPAYGIDAYYKRVGDDFVVRDDLGLTPEHIKELKEFAPLVKEAADRGHLNRSFIADAIGLLEGGRARRGGGFVADRLADLDTVTAISAMMFNQAERFNRQVSMLVSYDLAKQDAVKKGKPIDEALLTENAFRETHQLNGGSTLETAPPVVQQNIGRVAGMYKTYGMRMYTTMFNVGATALGQYNDILKAQGVPDAEIKERMSIARKQLVGLHGSAIFFAGIHGVPLYGAIELLHNMFAGDEEDDFNTEVRNYLGEGWYKGAVNQILSEAGAGIDVASRIRLTGLLLQTNRYNNDPSMEETLLYYAGGPAWSVMKRVGRGSEDLMNGEIQRGVESLLPVGISNAFKVLGRYQQDGGVYSRRGDAIYDDITGGEMVGQFFGFAPSEYTRIQEDNQRIKRIDNALSRKMSKLRKQYYLAYRQGDFSTLIDIKQKIREHNRNHPSFEITPDSIKRSMRQHMKTSSQMYNGVALSPNMRDVMSTQLEAERNGFVGLPD